MCAEMDLFAVVKLEKPKQVTVGVRPLREGEQPLLEATEGRLTVLPEVVPENTPLLQVTPVQSVAPNVETAQEEARAESSDSVEILKPEEVLIGDAESSAEEEKSAPGADKKAAEASPFL